MTKKPFSNTFSANWQSLFIYFYANVVILKIKVWLREGCDPSRLIKSTNTNREMGQNRTYIYTYQDFNEYKHKHIDNSNLYQMEY